MPAEQCTYTFSPYLINSLIIFTPPSALLTKSSLFMSKMEYFLYFTPCSLQIRLK